MTAHVGAAPRSTVRPASMRLAVGQQDAIALPLLLALAGAAMLFLARDSTAFIRGDWPTMFFPNYSWLGDRLRVHDVPAWNPNQFSGTPFAGDPSSGWGYFLAMLVYALLPAEPATTVFITLHVLLSA